MRTPHPHRWRNPDPSTIHDPDKERFRPKGPVMTIQPGNVELTPNESRIYESILNRNRLGTPPTIEDLRAEHYGTRTNTLATVSRAVNSLEEKGLVSVSHSTQRNEEIVTPNVKGDA